MRLVACVFMVGIALPASSVVHAEIILDDFTDPASVTSPLMEDIFVETLNVGDLDAQRRIRIGASGASDPYGTMDVSTTLPGKLTATIDRIVQTNSLTPVTSIQFRYLLSPSDLTQGGNNDAILVDVMRLTGSVQPTFFRAFAFTVSNAYELELPPLVPSTDPQTLAFPFEDFRTRGGVPGLDPLAVREIQFGFSFIGHSGILNWCVQIDRIRFGSTVVPEPSIIFNLLLGGSLLTIFGRNRRNL